MIDPSRAFLRWIPKRNSHPAVSFLINVFCIAVAVTIRFLFVGSQNTTVGSSLLLPALIIISLYAGWRWSLAVLTLIIAMLAFGVSRTPNAAHLQT